MNPINNGGFFLQPILFENGEIIPVVVEAMKNRSEGEHLRVYDKIYNKLTTAGFTPQLQKMDNEA